MCGAACPEGGGGHAGRPDRGGDVALASGQPRLVDAVHAEGGEVYVWTVDDAARIEKLRALGVHAVITNDPRLFG